LVLIDINSHFCTSTLGCIGPHLIRKLLQALRGPSPIEEAEVEECVMTLGTGSEYEEVPRISPITFERWYKKFYNIFDEDYS
jgi:hypothetical protein